MTALPPSAADDFVETVLIDSDDERVGDGTTEPEPIVLADGRAGGLAQPAVDPRRVGWQLAAAAVVVVAAVGIVGALVSERVAERQAVHDVAEQTGLIAQSVITPALTDVMSADPAEAERVLDPLVRANVLGPSLVRVKLWAPDGTILYSDESRLVGQRFPLDDEAASALTGPQTEASVSDLSRPENEFERSQGKLLEVYRPVWTPGGRPLLLETYFRYNIVSDRSHDLWRGFAGIIASSLIALLLLLTPIVWSLLRRARQAQEQRQAMMQRALASSGAERARLAASLHDGVVQQLVASSLQLSGQAQRAAAAGDRQRADDLNRAASTVRGSIGGLRSLLVEIYPPNLATAGLAAALRDLANTLVDGDITLVFDIDDGALARLSPTAAEAAFRVIQETLRNAAKHAGPATVTVTVNSESQHVRIDIDDDGTGFDTAAMESARDESMRAGHLGLQLIADAAHNAGAHLQLFSRPGQGTHYRMEIPAP